MYRRTTFALFLAFGIVFQQSHGVEVNVTDKDKLCLYANLMVNFSVSYEMAGNKSGTATFALPGNVTTNGSECGTTKSMLKLNFGEGHSWSMNFTTKEKMYQIDSIVFSCNLGDTSLFPNSTTNETVTVEKSLIIDVGTDTCYSCKSKDTIQASVVSQTLWNVLIQAFVSNGSKSENLTVCAADLPVTTIAPTTNTTSITTPAPVTNSTSTAPPATTSAPAPPTPTTGVYSVKPNENSTACLLASFGLRIGLYHANRYEEMNLNPNVTNASGLCGVDSSYLLLVSDRMTFNFTFTNDTKKFRLHALNITGSTSYGEPFSEGCANLSLWEASIGSSYMCNKEQNYTISDQLFLYTFNLHVQPFGVKKSAFSTAEDCHADPESFLVPIAVGVALIILILIVVVAYFIGRKRNMATGYESF